VQSVNPFAAVSPGFTPAWDVVQATRHLRKQYAWPRGERVTGAAPMVYAPGP
jgi:hypothetical protein